MLNYISDFPIFILPLGLILLYSLELTVVLVSGSTRSVRKTHYWARDLHLLDLTSTVDDISTKSSQYLPGWRFLFGSFPRFLSAAVAIFIIAASSDDIGYWSVLVAVLVATIIDWSCNWLVKLYCKYQYNKSTIKMANKSQ